MDHKKVCSILSEILKKAGYKNADNVSQDNLLEALWDYEKKYNEMLEHILMQESR